MQFEQFIGSEEQKSNYEVFGDDVFERDIEASKRMSSRYGICIFLEELCRRKAFDIHLFEIADSATDMSIETTRHALLRNLKSRGYYPGYG